MEGRKNKGIRVLLCVTLLIGVLISAVALVSAQAQMSGLSSADCVKCHAKPPADIAASGAGHKKITCQDCHVGHPPAVPAKQVIPSCSQCHMGKPHYDLKNCLTCHKNPHTPLNIVLSGNLIDPCLTCHTKQIDQLKQHKSKHTNLYCSTCHDVHGKIPACVQCHKPHSSEMTQADCKKCHKAHMPKNVVYADVPTKDCGACHGKVSDLLSASAAKHKAFNCVFCHQAKHKMVPQCQDCHGTKHPAGIMAKFAKCGDCHNIAHDLNNWTKVTTTEKPKDKPKKK